MNSDSNTTRAQAERDFQRARNQSFWTDIWARLSGQSMELLSFEEVKQKLRLQDDHYLGLQEIPLDNIVGSVGRYKDFNRKFLPKRSINKDRWKAVDALTIGVQGIPPIEVYKVGDAYFVIDGNHRVSVARAAGMPTIEAYVTEYRTDVPFERETVAGDLFIKQGYAEFLRQTKLKLLRPDSEVILTEPGRYPQILNHMEVHHYYMGLECQCPVTWEEAVASWYDHVYLPMVEKIREYKILDDFPKRTEADLYVWLVKHQGIMQENYGGNPMSPSETVDDFLDKLNAK